MRKRSRAALILTYTIVLGITLSVLIFFTYTLVLRTDYKSTALEINDAILSGCNMTISRGEDTFPATQETADYYNRFLLLQTDAFSRRSVPVTDKSIILRIGDREITRAMDLYAQTHGDRGLAFLPGKRRKIRRRSITSWLDREEELAACR